MLREIGGLDVARGVHYGLDMNTMTDRNDARAEQIIREYQSDLAEMVRLGDIDENTANEWAADLQDRLSRNGVWG